MVSKLFSGRNANTQARSNLFSGREQPSSNIEENNHPYLKNFAQALQGGGVGLAQGLSNIGANIAQGPSQAYTWATGKPGYQAPRPDITEYAPSSPVGQGAEKVGEFAAPFVSPAVGAEMAGIYGSRMLPRLIAGALGGAAEADPEHRGMGAAFGSTVPAIGAVAKKIWKTPLTEAAALKRMNKAEQLGAKSEPLNLPVNLDFLRNLEYQMGSRHLAPAKEQLNTLMGNAAKGDYKSYKEFQSALEKISRELTRPGSQSGSFSGMIKNWIMPQQTSAAERLTGQQLYGLRQQYITDVLNHMQKTGHGKLAALDKGGREDFKNYMQFKPTRNALIGSALIGAGVPGAGIIKKHL